jgi:hypothetical protein
MLPDSIRAPSGSCTPWSFTICAEVYDRIVRNERVSRALAKGILDANLLQAFMSLPLPRQEEFTRQIGTTKEVIIRDWNALQSVW